MKDATLVFIGGFDSWPPSEVCQMLSQELEGCRYEIFTNPGGFLSLAVIGSEGAQAFSFARLVFDGAANPLSIILSCGAEGPRLNINGKSIPLRSDPGSARVVLIKGAATSVPRPSMLDPIHPSSPPGVAEHEAFFVRTVHDLECASASDDSYTVLRASGVLRLLLLDGLLSRANARLREKIIFTTNDFNLEPPLGLPVAEIDWQCLSPERGGTVRELQVGLDKFLAAPVLRTPDTKASVRDVIQACANALGGIHFGGARNTREEAVIKLDKVQVMFGSKPSVQSLKDICRVTVRAFYPLVLAIQAS